uniref:Chemokine (C-X-C motif) receptor 5 n=1 Tax=Hucho hucho TaxID=62062 RepID=A0A4W5N4W9_9TELE
MCFFNLIFNLIFNVFFKLFFNLIFNVFFQPDFQTDFQLVFQGSFKDESFLSDFDNYSNESPNNSSSDTEYTCNDGAGLQLFHTVFQPLVYSLVFLLGLTGNGLMLTVLLKRRGLLRITEIYLLHLGLADLMLLATFPFALAQVSLGVVFGDVLCKLIGLLNRLNFLCGSLLLACIGFDRYLAIVHAITSLQSRRPRNVHLTCLALWLLCLALSAPNAVFLSVGESPIDPTQLSCFFHSHGLHANNWDLTVGPPQTAQHLF